MQLIGSDDISKVILSEEWRNIVVKWENITTKYSIQ